MGINPLHQDLRVVIVADAEDAIAQGFNYAAAPTGEYKPIRIKQVVVVRDGTEEHKPTVDFILEDEKGQKYVAMITGALIKAIPCGS